MSFFMKNLTLLLATVFLNSAYSSNIQNNSVQCNNYSNIGTVYRNCIINNNVQNNLNNTIPPCNTQCNIYSNINRVYDNCTINNNVMNNNILINPYNSFNYPFNNSLDINNSNNTFQHNDNTQNLCYDFDLDAQSFYPKNYNGNKKQKKESNLKNILLLIRKNKHNTASKYLDEFIKNIQNKNKINIPNNILSNWLNIASEIIDRKYNNELIEQKNEIIRKIENMYNTSNENNYEKIKRTIRNLVAINNDEEFLNKATQEFDDIKEEFNKSNLKEDILKLRKKTKEYYEQVENLKQLLINALADKDFSVKYEFTNNEDTIYEIITHLLNSGHIINNEDINRKKHAIKETLIHGIEDIEYYQNIKELIQYIYRNCMGKYEKLYKEKIYNIIQYCLVNPLINAFVNDNNKYISTFEFNKFSHNTYDNNTAALCVVNKCNHNKLVLNLNIQRTNVNNIKVTNTIKSFYGMPYKDYRTLEQRCNNYTNTYMNEINKNDAMYKEKYKQFKSNKK